VSVFVGKFEWKRLRTIDGGFNWSTVKDDDESVAWFAVELNWRKMGVEDVVMLVVAWQLKVS
jgi:hypothetical protein